MPHAPVARSPLAQNATVVITDAQRLVRIMLEALVGRRALHQVRERMGTGALLQLTDYVDSGVFRHAAPGRTRMQMPSPVAVEAVTLVRVGARWLGCTMRLDRVETRWHCSSIHVLGL